MKVEAEGLPQIEDTILPEYRHLYEYAVDDHKDEIEVKIHLKGIKNVSSADVKSLLTRDKAALSITFRTKGTAHRPICFGKLYRPVTGLSRTVAGSDDDLIVTLSKRDKAAWPVLISDFFPGEADIDPQSAYRLSCFRFSRKLPEGEKDPEDSLRIRQFFGLSVRAGYCPALMTLWQSDSAEQKDEKMEAMALENVERAAHVYHYPEALFILADRMMTTGADARELQSALEEAAKAGSIRAKALLGCLFSPTSALNKQHHFPVDAKRAFELLEEVVTMRKDPDALACLSQLLARGIGCKRDEERARRLDVLARRLKPELPPLVIPKPRAFWKTWWFWSIVVVVLMILVLVIARPWRRGGVGLVINQTNSTGEVELNATGEVQGEEL